MDQALHLDLTTFLNHLKQKIVLQVLRSSLKDEALTNSTTNSHKWWPASFPITPPLYPHHHPQHHHQRQHQITTEQEESTCRNSASSLANNAGSYMSTRWFWITAETWSMLSLWAPVPLFLIPGFPRLRSRIWAMGTLTLRFWMMPRILRLLRGGKICPFASLWTRYHVALGNDLAILFFLPVRLSCKPENEY